MLKRFTNIISKQHVTKLNKYVVEIGMDGEPKERLWLTEKQMINLNSCFEETPKGYSNGDISVIGVFNDNGYYAYAKVVKHKKPKYFNVPKEHDLSDLMED
ncbi:hypothetical protein [Hathewaya massiliensis]|uniref:hypothetical protein n=1 Tax=Hathewaya massiliensis TaxID=1964382 RepID=UPI001158C7DB|nr:hypothetical protein [Hathewaya massiliensis]